MSLGSVNEAAFHLSGPPHPPPIHSCRLPVIQETKSVLSFQETLQGSTNTDSQLAGT